MDIYKAFGIYKGLGDWEDEETYPHGMNKEQFNKLKEHFDKISGNYKMADIPCALGMAQLKSFD